MGLVSPADSLFGRFCSSNENHAFEFDGRLGGFVPRATGFRKKKTFQSRLYKCRPFFFLSRVGCSRLRIQTYFFASTQAAVSPRVVCSPGAQVNLGVSQRGISWLTAVRVDIRLPEGYPPADMSPFLVLLSFLFLLCLFLLFRSRLPLKELGHGQNLVPSPRTNPADYYAPAGRF